MQQEQASPTAPPTESASVSDANVRRRRLDVLTSMRFFAALVVLGFHSVFFADISTFSTSVLRVVKAVIDSGYVGVGFFFVLSGFILPYAYLAKEGRHLDKPGFFVARLARIFPMHIVGLIFIYDYQAVFLHYRAEPLSWDIVLEALPRIMTFVTMLNAWFPAFATQWNPPNWSLSAEFFFYLVFPMAAAVIWRWSGRKALVAGGVIWAIGLAMSFAYIAFPGITPWSKLNSLSRGVSLDFIKLSPLTRLPEFLVGICIGRWYLSSPQEPKVSGIWAFLALCLVIVLLTQSSSIAYLPLHNGLLAPLFAVIVLWGAGEGGLVRKIFENPVLVKLGEASFALYITHYAVIAFAIKFRVSPVFAGIAGTTYWLMMVAVAIALSLVFHMSIERPAQRFIVRTFHIYRLRKGG